MEMLASTEDVNMKKRMVLDRCDEKKETESLLRKAQASDDGRSRVKSEPEEHGITAVTEVWVKREHDENETETPHAEEHLDIGSTVLQSHLPVATPKLHTMETECVLCVNCGSASGSMVLDDGQILRCIQQWTAPQPVQPHDIICTRCWTEAQEATRAESNVGCSCVMCNTPLPRRTRSHQIIALRTDTQHHVNIKNIILERLVPMQALASHFICHPCWQQADRTAKRYSAPSASRATSSAGNQMRCVNCGINILRMRRHILNDPSILVQIQRRVSPRVVTTADYICDACHRIFFERDTSMHGSQDAPLVGHRNVCVGCGCSMAQERAHIVQAENNRHILHIVQHWIQPQDVQPSHLICHRCFQRAEVSARTITPCLETDPLLQDPEKDQFQKHSERITLPNYSRAPDTHAKCIFPQCGSTSQQMVPHVIRVKLFADYNYYIPPNCRICACHLEAQAWTDLVEVENANHSFTSAYIEDFCELLKADRF